LRATSVTIPAKLLQRGDNRRKLGEDLMAGRAALSQGTRLSPAACGLLASLGIATVPVFRRLKVAYFSTGDEILSLGEPPREGAVYDSNRYTVFGLLTRLGCEVIDLGVVRDEPALLEAAFTRAAQQADAIITSGGVSVGEADFTKTMMKQLGDVAFWRIAMRPGRPMAVGRISGNKLASPQREMVASSYPNNSNLSPSSAILFGLPGNPVAVMVTFLAFVRPALLRMMGNTSAPPAAAEGAKPGVDPQEAGPHRVPARHRQHRGRRHAASAHHRQPGLGRAEFHGAGQRPDRAAPRSGQRGSWRRGRRDDVRRCDLAP
jgi:molybdopterin molybdotransferase